jgi:hypothetical protein
MQNKFSEERVQSIMESFGGMQPAAAPDFFYTRLRAKMEQPLAEKKMIFILRPAFITTALAVLLIANVISLLQTDKLPKQEPSAVQSKPATIESFATAYDINTGSSVYE